MGQWLGLPWVAWWECWLWSLLGAALVAEVGVLPWSVGLGWLLPLCGWVYGLSLGLGVPWTEHFLE